MPHPVVQVAVLAALDQVTEGTLLAVETELVAWGWIVTGWEVPGNEGAGVALPDGTGLKVASLGPSVTTTEGGMKLCSGKMVRGVVTEAPMVMAQKGIPSVTNGAKVSVVVLVPV